MKILIAEDNLVLSESLVNWLEKEGYTVDSARDGLEALNYLNANKYDLLILDWVMPNFSGIEICKEYRQNNGSAYIIMLTGQKELKEKMQGFDTGVDDYITKPFEMSELLARIRAFNRRVGTLGSIYHLHHNFKLDIESRELSIRGNTIKLKPTELCIIEHLLKHDAQIVSAQSILEHCWKNSPEAELSLVYTCISKLKHKLGLLDAAQIISSIKGAGYSLDFSSLS